MDAKIDLVELTVSDAVRLGTTNLISYGRIFFPNTFRQDSPQMHYDIGDALYSPLRQVAIEVFRDGAKTTLLRTYLSQRVAYAISRTIMVVSASQTHSCLTLAWLKRQVETNKKWAQAFGLEPGRKWTEDHVEVYHRAMDIYITVLAVGITGQVRGFNIDDFRPDLIIADDTSTDEMTATEEQRKKYENLFFGALLNSLAPETESPLAKIVLLDTPKNKFDLIESCETRPDWKFIRYGILDEDNKSRWESRYPTAQVLKQKHHFIAAGQTELWMREKECKVISSELSSFKAENLVFYTEVPERMTVIITIDPASSDSKTADDQVIMAVGLAGSNFYVLEYTAHKGEMPEEAWITVSAMIQRWKPIAIVSESISYQRVLAWYLEQKMRESRKYIAVHRLEDKRKKSDRIVQHIGGISAYGRLHVRDSQTELVVQYSEYSPRYKGHDDILDALAMAVYWAETNGYDAIEGEYSVEYDHSYLPNLEKTLCP